MRPSRLAMLVLFSAAAAIPGRVAQSQQGAQRGSIHGVVRDTSGTPIPMAEVIGPTGRTLSDSIGRFRLGSIPVGMIPLQARRLGYRPVVWTVEMRGAGAMPVAVTLVPVPRDLEAVVVAASHPRNSRNLRGFYTRRRRSSGYFLTREQIEPHDHANLTDVLRARVPAAQVSGIGMGRSRLRLRGQRCAPMVWIDGAPTPAAEFDLDFIQPSTVAGIEIYANAASAPAEFRVPMSRDACGGTILIWSRIGAWEAGTRAERTAAARDEGPPVPVYHADEVDEPAGIDTSELVPPLYPDSLRAFDIEGSVVALLIVDTTGAPVPGSIGIVSATNDAFGEAVTRAISVSRFLPARRNGVLVRQVLVVPYDFTARPR